MGRPLEPVIPRFEAKIEKDSITGCWLWTSNLFDSGYGAFSTSGPIRTHRAHRFSWELHKGIIPNGLYVLHKCDVRRCVNPEHLFLGTPKTNADDMIAKGRHVATRGEAHPLSKLTNKKVIKIRKAFKKNPHLNKTHLAKKFGICGNTLRGILLGTSWPHIKL